MEETEETVCSGSWRNDAGGGGGRCRKEDRSVEQTKL